MPSDVRKVSDLAVKLFLFRGYAPNNPGAQPQDISAGLTVGQSPHLTSDGTAGSPVNFSKKSQLSALTKSTSVAL
jgi:hypothetical protein